jgi:orotidine-5'-phosphate decarboxylase
VDDRVVTKAFIAVDTTDPMEMWRWLYDCVPPFHGIKLGAEFMCGIGPDLIWQVEERKVPILLDLKLHDVPTTVARTVAAVVARCSPWGITVHAAAGTAALRAAVEAIARELAP